MQESDIDENLVIGRDAKQVSVIGGVVNFAETETVWNYRVTKF